MISLHARDGELSTERKKPSASSTARRKYEIRASVSWNEFRIDGLLMKSIFAQDLHVSIREIYCDLSDEYLFRLSRTGQEAQQPGNSAKRRISSSSRFAA